jgi:hypothetical protein
MLRQTTGNRSLWSRLALVSQAALRFVVRDALAVPLKPFASVGDCIRLLFGFGFVVDRSVVESRGDWIVRVLAVFAHDPILQINTATDDSCAPVADFLKLSCELLFWSFAVFFALTDCVQAFFTTLRTIRGALD